MRQDEQGNTKVSVTKIVAPGTVLLATVPGGVAAAGNPAGSPLALPLNARTIRVVTPGMSGINYPVISGSNTGPTNFAPIYQITEYLYEMQIEQAIDASVTVQFASAPPKTWYVLATTTPEFYSVQTASESIIGQPVGSSAIVVGGANASNLTEPFNVDASGNLKATGGKISNLTAAYFDLIIGSGATGVAVAAVSGKVITVYKLDAFINNFVASPVVGVFRSSSKVSQ